MINDDEVARQLSETALEVGRLLNDVLFAAQEKCPEAELLALRRAVGQVLGELLLSVLNPLYRAHPELRPEGFDTA